MAEKSEDTIPVETVKWREGIAKTVSSIDKRTIQIESVVKNCVTGPQMTKAIDNRLTHHLDKHKTNCDMERQLEDQRRQIEELEKEATEAQNASVKKTSGGFFKNVSWIKLIKVAVFIGVLLSAFVIGLFF